MSRRTAPRHRGRRTVLTVVVVALAVAGLALPARAFFSVGSTDATGASRAATLGTPTVATSGVTASSVTFTVTAPTTGPAPTSYRVARTAPTAASTVCTVTGSSGSCTDTAPVQGQTNTYAVYARLGGSTWESPTPGTASVVVPAADSTAPVTTASVSPAPNAAGWDRTAVTVTLNATDASGVASTFYGTTASGSTTPPSTYTTYAAPFTVSASAEVWFYSVDTRGNTETPQTLEVRIDTAAPTGAVTSPSANAVVGGTVTVSGSASDTGGSGIASVQPQVQQGSSGTWTNLGAAITTGTASWSTSWVTTTGFPDGTYNLRAVVTDVAGSSTTTSTVAVTVDNTAPSGAVTSPTSGGVVGGTVTVSGTSADTGGSGVASVQPQVQQGSSGTWTNLGGAITTGTASWSTSWVTTTGFADGAYNLRAVITDVANRTSTTPTVAVTVQNTTLTVTPATTTPVAGTPFNLTIRTGNNITGSQAITVSGLANGPTSGTPTVPTTATFAEGIATISVTAVKAGSQTIVVNLTSDNRQGSTTVVVSPKPQGQLFFSSCSGTSVNCPANSGVSSFSAPRGSNVTFVLSRRAADDYGNSLVDAAVSVTLLPSSGTVSSTSFTLGAGVAASGTLTYTPPGNSPATRTIDASGTTSGVAVATARLTVTFQ